ncbi:hypothetical protein I6A84_10060 [Frankia sp. CNm7]|uniref:Uncharacterized protein n=1 Tax=Frankia nepalensis TaxID=1836974 RepID=A0A937RHM3_9ACTN|nr:hypothetical protein [Frankia nepalensis]MBL7498779.1 hypothetical protein [Frankia nepalensis]MBL7508357.1 hypothetical protein [Frankia nepalensis]MBL7518445.1 hypothetical protein [Frankia nepalensis]MBL7626186.1 hypothetical protein [Frankia nepalensis]
MDEERARVERLERLVAAGLDPSYGVDPARWHGVAAALIAARKPGLVAGLGLLYHALAGLLFHPLATQEHVRTARTEITWSVAELEFAGVREAAPPPPAIGAGDHLVRREDVRRVLHAAIDTLYPCIETEPDPLPPAQAVIHAQMALTALGHA